MNLGAATLSRLLKGAATKNQPDSVNLKKAIDWLGRPLSDFEPGRAPASTTWADVELHFRALPDLDEDDVETLVAMAKAGYEKARELRQSKKTQG